MTKPKEKLPSKLNGVTFQEIVIFRVIEKPTPDLAGIKLIYHQYPLRQWRNQTLLKGFYIPEDRILPSCCLTDLVPRFRKKVTLPRNMKISAVSSSKFWHCVPNSAKLHGVTSQNTYSRTIFH